MSALCPHKDGGAMLIPDTQPVVTKFECCPGEFRIVSLAEIKSSPGFRCPFCGSQVAWNNADLAVLINRHVADSGIEITLRTIY
jgi:hypothetical protein